MAEYKQFYMRVGFMSHLTAGDETFTHIDLKVACWLYDEKGFTLYEVKEAGFRDFTLKQIAMAIKHGRWDQGRVLYHNRPGVSWHPDNMVLTGFRVGEARFTEDEAAGEEW